MPSSASLGFEIDMRRKFVFSLSCLLFSSSFYDATVSSGFRPETIAEGINAGTALATTPDGRVYVAEQTGHVRIVEDGVVLERPLLDLSETVNTNWERGLIGMQFDPEYPLKPYLFVVYVGSNPYVHHFISRFAIVGGVADLNSDVILLEGDDQATSVFRWIRNMFEPYCNCSQVTQIR